MPEVSKKYLYILVLVGVIIFMSNLDVMYVNIMEARNFITAREMVNMDNWLLTTMNAEPRYEKPPLPTWFTALSAMLFGFNSLFALRLPAALLALFLLFYFFRLIPRLKIGQKQAFLASLILASSFYIIFAGRNGQWDIFTHGFMMAAIYYLWKFFGQTHGLYKNALLAALFFGFSFMSKGPVSLYALLLPFLIAYGVVYGLKGFSRKKKPFLLFLFTAIIISGWWFLYVRLVDPVAFTRITTVETTRWANYNVKPFYYYWSFFTQSGIWTIPAFVGLLYPYLKRRVCNHKAYVFSLLWTLSAVILLSIIPEKKARYLLPVMIPLALNTSFYIEYLFRKFREMPLKEKWVVYFNHGLIAAIGIVFPVGAYFVLDLEGYWFWYVMTSIILFGIGAAIIYFLKKQKYPKVFYLTVVFICGIMLTGFPLTYALLENPKFRNISELQNKYEFNIYELRNTTPELIWEYGEPISNLSEEEVLQLDDEKMGLLLMEKDSVFVQQQDRFRIISSERYDLNYVHPEKSGYKDRLIRRFYVLEKKE
ncbi:4-amino-4-deoxy-L-arabinose transferase [Salinimicrobium catena]|uniref:4-amino-4-deoxy-L-arabinose transferase n=1 Tax=Salinimicrobium catena TaxID=390640 RepID=A0A1H5NCK4_9FLAO|nr:glycosyltransferase family 39 protein [Salinimicrobium catena]SDL42952.1 4-amino-4-deoxy-L-arabinose transferase [Salinimicrobium catena]SEE99313.1 4-amino-4-deoxy-L-arabinose transferase [Salinimicrobium catena]